MQLCPFDSIDISHKATTHFILKQLFARLNTGLSSYLLLRCVCVCCIGIRFVHCNFECFARHCDLIWRWQRRQWWECNAVWKTMSKRAITDDERKKANIWNAIASHSHSNDGAMEWSGGTLFIDRHSCVTTILIDHYTLMYEQTQTIERNCTDDIHSCYGDERVRQKFIELDLPFLFSFRFHPMHRVMDRGECVQVYAVCVYVWPDKQYQ